ncbi:MAG: hypothetical protein KTR31_32650 [Myxococcales bacterium]|nr:hypothetical protein [Myxococcales bacterium]
MRPRHHWIRWTALALVGCSTIELDPEEKASLTPAAKGASCAPAGAQLWSTWWTGDDCVVVDSGTTVVLDTDADVVHLDIKGELLFDCTDLHLQTDRIDVLEGGRLTVGTSVAPFEHEATITLTESLGAPCGPEPSRELQVHGGGTLDLHGDYLADDGTPRIPWTRLAATASAGTSALSVQDEVDWQAGDEVVVASTDFAFDQAESRTLASDAASSTLTLQSPLLVPHWGETEGVGTDTIEVRAEVGLLSRNVRVTSDATDDDSGQILATSHSQAPTVRIDWAEVTNLGATGMLGVYPIHFHHVGNAQASYVRRSAIHDNHFRAVTIHATHDLEVTDNVAFDSHGHLFYLEDGSETGNVLRGNLGLVTYGVPVLAGCSAPQACVESDAEPGIFYVRHPDNVVEDNVAAGSDGHGFYFQPEAQETASPTSFRGNVSHSNHIHGFFQDDPPTPTKPARFEDFTAYKNRQYGVWLRTWNEAELTGFRVADNRAGFYLASGGWQANYSLVTLRDAVAIGVTDNIGAELTGCLGRSLHDPNNPTDYISGVDLYDGRTLVDDVRFYAFAAADCAGDPRPAGAISQTHKQNRWAIDPRNAFTNLYFDKGVNEVWFRSPDPGISGVASAVLADPTGTVDGAPGWIVPANPLLVPPSGASFVKEWNAWKVEPANHHYAQIQIVERSPKAVGSLFVRGDNQLNSVRVDVPPAQPSDRFGFNVLADDQAVYTYDVEWPKVAPDDLLVTLRFGEPGAATYLTIDHPVGATPTVLHLATGTALTAEASVADAETSAQTAWYYDAATGTIYLKLVLPAGGQLLDFVNEESVRIMP